MAFDATAWPLARAMVAQTVERSGAPGPIAAWTQRHLRRRVNDICGPPRREVGPDARGWDGADRIAIMVHWSADGVVSRSVSETVGQLDGLGYQVAVVSTCDAPGLLRWPHGRPDGAAVYRRPNVGIDFGSWGAMLSALPMLRKAGKVLLLNDSMVGPFAPMDSLIESFEHANCDVWGLASTTQIAPHFQSSFIGYKGGVLADGPLAAFWTDVRLQPSKEVMIKRHARTANLNSSSFGTCG